MNKKRQLTSDEMALLVNGGPGRGYVPKGDDDEPDEAPLSPGSPSPSSEADE